MAAPYLSELHELLAEALGAQAAGVECKHFFSGAATYVDGIIFATLSPVGLALKLPEATCRAELRLGARPLRYFPGSPIKRGYVVFEDVARVGPGRVESLLRQAIDHARSTRAPQ